jgi:hypothetical protein
MQVFFHRVFENKHIDPDTFDSWHVCAPICWLDQNIFCPYNPEKSSLTPFILPFIELRALLAPYDAAPNPQSDRTGSQVEDDTSVFDRDPISVDEITISPRATEGCLSRTATLSRFRAKNLCRG